MLYTYFKPTTFTSLANVSIHNVSVFDPTLIFLL